jgi:hypothetical protein
VAKNFSPHHENNLATEDTTRPAAATKEAGKLGGWEAGKLAE